MSTVTVKKWGNSPAVRLTADVMRQAKLSVNDQVEIMVTDGEITLKRVDVKPTLAQLVAQITPENRHDMVDWGRPVGKEAGEW
ncbi:hypothetical protein NLN82_22540 [Citrobacter portucalensis]|uniref:AbrB/MazE/SpoVT family DNA-binding domain-containing protein n=1 Tax=Citrobacter portucalensis TaxID=1639133 RepID=UPI00226B7D63|nr:hypothetical protein [Citrobacter portucalensis]MCX9038806.1 hypothetical protein [Citrobacter portucalensis]